MCFEQRVMFLWLISVLWKLRPTERLLGRWAFSVVLSNSVSVRQDALIPFWLWKEKEGGWSGCFWQQNNHTAFYTCFSMLLYAGCMFTNWYVCLESWTINGCKLEAETIRQWLERQWAFDGPFVRFYLQAVFPNESSQVSQQQRKFELPFNSWFLPLWSNQPQWEEMNLFNMDVAEFTVEISAAKLHVKLLLLPVQWNLFAWKKKKENISVFTSSTLLTSGSYSWE